MSTDIGAIVGGTVGGVVGLLAILLLLWFCVFKKRRDRKGDFDDMMVCLPFLPNSTRLILLRSLIPDEIDTPRQARPISSTMKPTMMSNLTPTARTTPQPEESLRCHSTTRAILLPPPAVSPPAFPRSTPWAHLPPSPLLHRSPVERVTRKQAKAAPMSLVGPHPRPPSRPPDSPAEAHSLAQGKSRSVSSTNKPRRTTLRRRCPWPFRPAVRPRRR